MRIFRAFRIAAVFVATTSPAVFAGQQLALECKLPKQKKYHWVQPVMFIGHVAGEKEAIVADPLILYANKRPIRARVTADTEKRLTVKWTLKNLEDKHGREVQEFYYTASYMKDSGMLSVTARPRNYDNTLSGQGRCTPIDPKLLKRKWN